MRFHLIQGAGILVHGNNLAGWLDEPFHRQVRFPFTTITDGLTPAEGIAVFESHAAAGKWISQNIRYQVIGFAFVSRQGCDCFRHRGDQIADRDVDRFAVGPVLFAPQSQWGRVDDLRADKTPY